MENGGDSFHKNEYSWNKEANMLYIESPVGVGYSYAYQVGDHNYTDDAVANDNLLAMISFYLVKFPEYVKNELWISGESYAGIYVPYLALKIDKYNAKAPEGGFKMNLKGFIVGNGVTNWKYDSIPAYMEMGFWHSLYDLDLYEKSQKFGCPK